MTLPEILANEELRRHEFPVCRDKVFLAHAGVCPLPRRVAEAIRSYAEQCTLGDQETLLPAFQMDETRELAARLLGCLPTEIAFVGPTTLALNYVAAGLRFRRRDNLVIYFDDYPSNVYPWMALARQGVQVRMMPVKELGRITRADVLGQVDEDTRLVALASCHYVAGWRLDLDALGRELRERGVLFCVDGIQTVGAFPTRVEHVDFLAADAHKWLLGPCAAGLFYVRKSLQEKLHPTVFGWHNVKCPDFIAREEFALRQDARRYEAGSANLLGFVGLRAALELLLEIGVENIAAELLRKRAWLVKELTARGWNVLHPGAPPAHASGIVSFWRPDTDLAALHEKLTAAGIITSLRADRTGRRYIRLSPHFYNTDAELARVLETL
jgi:cysteine desulfurase / selenocysteine lyase